LSRMQRTVPTLQFLSTFSFPLSVLHEISFKIIFICSAWILFQLATEFLAVEASSYRDWRRFGSYIRSKTSYKLQKLLA
jgi:hypothetical protein